MADTITKSLGPSQSAGTVGKMLTMEASATGGIHDDLMPMTAKSAAKSAPFDLRVEDRTTDALPGSTWTFKTPQVDTITDTFLVIDVNAASLGSTTAQNVALNVIDYITIRSCGTVQEIPYRDVMRYVLANNTAEERQVILSKAGGAQTATAEGGLVVPLLAFWTPYGMGRIRRNHPGLPSGLLSTGVEVEIRMAPVTDLLAAGNTFDAAAFSSVKLVHQVRQQDACALSDARAAGTWQHWGYEYQRIPQVGVAAAATTSLDCDRFKGNSAGVAIFPVTTANETGRNFYECVESIAEVEVNIDSSLFLRVNTNISALNSKLVMAYLSHHWGLSRGEDPADPTFSHFAAILPFGGSIAPGKDGESSEGTGATYEGSLNFRAIQSLKIDLKNDSATEVQMHTLNLDYARFSLDGGLIKRDL